MIKRWRDLPEDIRNMLVKHERGNNVINEWAVTLNNKFAIVPEGKYKGRWAQIKQANFNGKYLVAQLVPFNIKKRDGSLIDIYPEFIHIHLFYNTIQSACAAIKNIYRGSYY